MNDAQRALFELPQNQLRKAFALKACILELEALQRRYRPIFDEDPGVVRLLELANQEREAAMAALRSRLDAKELLDAYFEEVKP